MKRSCFLVLVSCFLLVGCQPSKVTDKTIIELKDLPEYLSSRVTPVDEREYTRIRIGERFLEVEKADTPKKIETGLSYREEIGSDGLLFYMPKRGVPTFWMKGMLMDLDMIWIDCGGSNTEIGTSNIDDAFDELVGEIATIEGQECLIVDVSKNVPKAEDPTLDFNDTIRSPKAPVTHVLEVQS